MTQMDASSNETITWPEIFAEGERRIHQYFLDATVITDPHDRVRLLTRRRVIKQRMNAALMENNAPKLQRALREQVRLLAHIQQLCNHSTKLNEPLPVPSV